MAEDLTQLLVGVNPSIQGRDGVVYYRECVGEALTFESFGGGCLL